MFRQFRRNGCPLDPGSELNLVEQRCSASVGSARATGLVKALNECDVRAHAPMTA